MRAERERFLKPGTSAMPIIFKQWQSAGNILENGFGAFILQGCLFHSFYYYRICVQLP